jgi:septum site-determining protein MinD
MVVTKDKIFKSYFPFCFMGKTIGVISLKGGVGKTSSVVSLGAALSQMGKKVLLVDGNFSCPNLGMHLNLIDPDKTIHHVMGEDLNIEEAIQKLDYFDVLPASVFYSKRVDPLRLREKLRFLKSKYDIILLDSSPSLNEETLGVIVAADELIVVSTPDYPTLGMTMKAIKLAKQRGTPITGIILNKVHGKDFELSLKDIERTSEVPVMAVIPHDLEVLRSLSNFAPYTSSRTSSEGVSEYTKLAHLLAGEKYKEKRKIRYLFKRRVPQQEVNRQIFYTSVFAK